MMELIKMGDKYLVKGSNGIIINEKEKLELERKELILEDIKKDGCAKKIIEKRKKIEKKLKEVENETIEEAE